MRRLDPDPGLAFKAHENEKRDMNGAQPSIGVFVRGKCWLAGWAARAAGSLGDVQTGVVHGEPVGGAAARQSWWAVPAQDRSRPQTIASTTLPRRLMHRRGEAAARTSPGRWWHTSQCRDSRLAIVMEE
jgi:hypothetical protein